MLDRKEVKSVEWVETHSMLADALTKKGGNAVWIKEGLKENFKRERREK